MIKIFSNKLVLAMLALMVGTVANAAVKLSIGKVTGVLPKATIEIPVYLENDADVSTVGFDVRLPKGITPTAMAKNNERAKGSQGWACNIQPTVENPGAFRAGLYSFEKKIAAGEGLIATITAVCADVIEDGDIVLENVEVTLTDNTVVEVETENGSVSTSTVYPGNLSFTADKEFAVYAGQEIEVAVALNNDIELRSFQADMQLPEGFTLVFDEDEDAYKIIPADRVPQGTSFSYNVNNGRIIMLNMSGEPLVGSEGTLFTFTVKTPEQMPAESEITLKGFSGQVKGYTTSFDFNSDITIKVLDQLVLDYKAAQAALEAVKASFEAAQTTNDAIRAKIIAQQQEAIDAIQGQIDALDAIANPEEMKRFDVADFNSKVAAAKTAIDNLNIAVDAAYKANADAKERLNKEIAALQKDLDDAAADIADRNEYVQGQVEGRVAEIQDAINGAENENSLQKFVDDNYNEGKLTENSQLPENTVQADIAALIGDVEKAQTTWNNYQAAKNSVIFLQGLLDKTTDAEEDPILEKIIAQQEQTIAGIQEEINGLSEKANPEVLDPAFDLDAFSAKAAEVVNEIANLGKAIKDAYKDNADAKTRLDAEADALQDKLNKDVKDIVKGYPVKVQELLADDIAAIEKEIGEVKTAVAEDYNNGVLTANSNIAEEAAKILAEIAQLAKDAIALNENYGTNQSVYLNLQKDIQEVKDYFQEAKDEINALEDVSTDDFAEEIAEIDGDIASLQKEIDDLLEALELTKESTINTKPVIAKIDALKAAAKALQAKHDANKAAYERLIDEIGEFTKALEEVLKDKDEDVLAILNPEVDAIQAAIADIVAGIDKQFEAVELNAESQLPENNIQEMIDALKKHADELQQKYAANKAIKDELQKTIDAAQDALDAAKKHIDEELNYVALADYQEDVDKIQEEIDKKQSALDKALDELSLTEESTVDTEDVLAMIKSLVEAADAEQAAEDAAMASAAEVIINLNKTLDDVLAAAKEAGVKDEEIAEAKAAAEAAVKAVETFAQENEGDLAKKAEEFGKLVEAAEAAIQALAENIDEVIYSWVIIGDANHDAKVNNDDVDFFIEKYLANELPEAGTDDFTRFNANGDENITLADAVAIFNLANGLNWDGTDPNAESRAAEQLQGRVSVKSAAMGNGVTRYTLILKSNFDYSAFAINVKGQVVNESAEGMNLRSTDLAGDIHRIAAYNFEQAAEGNGTVLSFDVMGDAEFSSIEFATPSARSYMADLSSVTGIGFVAAAPADSTVFDLNGRSAKGLKKGVNIVRDATGKSVKVVK